MVGWALQVVWTLWWGGKVLPLQRLFVCAQYVTVAPCICEVRCYTSDVFLHSIHVVIVITSVQDIYNYVPESDRVAGVYIVATVLSLLLLVQMLSFFVSVQVSDAYMLTFCLILCSLVLILVSLTS
jgi:hypothetical protein